MKTYGEGLLNETFAGLPDMTGTLIPRAEGRQPAAIVIQNHNVDSYGSPIRQPRIDQPRVKLPRVS